jgi:hypothetical protein
MDLIRLLIPFFLLKCSILQNLSIQKDIFITNYFFMNQKRQRENFIHNSEQKNGMESCVGPRNEAMKRKRDHKF